MGAASGNERVTGGWATGGLDEANGKKRGTPVGLSSPGDRGRERKGVKGLVRMEGSLVHLSRPRVPSTSAGHGWRLRG
jgi:hypothetical protein